MLGWTPIAFGKAKPNHQPGYTYIKAIEDLNGKFDFAVLNSPGTISRDGRLERLGKLTVPFGVQTHSENDPKTFGKQIEQLFAHPKFKLFLPCAKNMWDPTPKVPTHVYYNCHHERLKVNLKNKKHRLILSTARLTSSKRVIEFVRQAPALAKEGFEVEVWGGKSTFFYYRDLITINQKSWKYQGGYDSSQLDDILGGAMYHWNCRAFKRGHPFAARLEFATVEAAVRGAIPIVHGASTPPEFGDTLLRVDANDPELDLVEAIDNYEWDPFKFEEAFNDLYTGKEPALVAEIEQAT
jgi:hypothetical protein